MIDTGLKRSLAIGTVTLCTAFAACNDDKSCDNVGETPCGIGIRESNGLITTNISRFVPHLIR